MNNIANTILVVDDNKLVRDAMCAVLNDGGFTCFTASDGDVAERLLEAVSADIIITDINMPKQHGFDTIKNIKTRWPDKKVIAISGSSEYRKYSELALFHGANIFIQKPVSTGKLLCAVYDCIEK